MVGARVYFQAYTEDGEYFETLTTCLMVSQEGETELVFEARVHAHVCILNGIGPLVNDEPGYDWEFVPIVS